MKNLIPIFIFLLLIGGCVDDPTPDPSEVPEEVEGMRPIYFEGHEWKNFSVSGPEPVQNLGKIYYKNPHIFVIERNKGIHILDNTNPANPTAIRFINLKSCRDVAIKGNILYADNHTDLLSIDISNFDNIQLVNRLADLYPKPLNFPENYSGYFECVDPVRGEVGGWETAILTRPECRR